MSKMTLLEKETLINEGAKFYRVEQNLIKMPKNAVLLESYTGTSKGKMVFPQLLEYYHHDT